MLNKNKVVKYVKDQLGFPFQPLEIDDDKIWDFIKDNTLNEFSYYQPYKKLMGMNLSNSALKVPGKPNEFYMVEEEGLEVLNIIGVYFNFANDMINGHPLWGPMGLGELKNWALDVEVAGMLKSSSSFSYEGTFVHPNIVRILPVPNGDLGVIAIEYETQQPEDLSGIRNDVQLFFKKFALADIMILLGRLRKRYGDGQLRTPFGEVPLSSEILDEGKELKREITEKLEQMYIPNITFSKG